MKHFITSLFTLFTLVLYSQTESVQITPPLSETSPAQQGMSEERLERIDRMLNQAIDQNEIPGAVALIARNGKIVYHMAFGIADHESGRPFKKDDIFRIASQTKAITSTAVMMLWEEGKFRLDDPISRYIPEFKNEQVLESFNESDSTFSTRPADKPITIRHLLTHTSGLGYGMIDAEERFRKIYHKAGIVDLFTTEPVSLQENIRKLAALPLHHDPGEKFTYSEGLDVLGHFVEIMAEMPLDQFFRQRIFEPLGMEDSWFYLPESKQERLVPVQTKRREHWVNYTASFYDVDYPIKGAKTFFSGGAGLSSTARDYAVFLQMYLNQGEYNGIRLLSRTTIEMMMANHIGDLRGSENYHGLAFGVVDEQGQVKGGRGSEGTFEWGGYFNTQYFADPKEDLIAILMKQTQTIPSDNTGWKFRQLVGQAVDD